MSRRGQGPGAAPVPRPPRHGLKAGGHELLQQPLTPSPTRHNALLSPSLQKPSRKNSFDFFQLLTRKSHWASLRPGSGREARPAGGWTCLTQEGSKGQGSPAAGFSEPALRGSPEHPPFPRELQQWQQQLELSTGSAGSKSITRSFRLLTPRQPRAGEATKASSETLWHRPRLLHHKPQTAAQVAFSILHTLLDSELDKSQSVQNGDHTTRSRIVGSSSIPMAQKRLVEVWRGQARAGGFLPTAF